jgi:hypothetical protein
MEIAIAERALVVTYDSSIIVVPSAESFAIGGSGRRLTDGCAADSGPQIRQIGAELFHLPESDVAVRGLVASPRQALMARLPHAADDYSRLRAPPQWSYWQHVADTTSN